MLLIPRDLFVDPLNSFYLKMLNIGGIDFYNLSLGSFNFYLILAASILIFAITVFVLIRLVLTNIKISNHKNKGKVNSHVMSIRALEDHMQNLAKNHVFARKSIKIDIIRIVNKKSYNDLKRIKLELSSMPGKIITLVPSAKWLFDNYYLMYKELTRLNKTSSIKDKRNFPTITSGHMKGYLRIYAIASEIVVCSSNHLDDKVVKGLLNAYQSVSPLTSAELWAFPTILKGCILEAILISSQDILKNIRTKIDADILMSRLTSQLRISDKTIVELLAANLNKDKIENYSYMSHILYCLKNVSADESKIREYIIEAMGYDSNEHHNIVSEIIHKETRLESIYRNTIRALIVSLKEMSELNWEEIFEEISPIENVLMNDPAQVYKLMDFQTRDLYRHQIEKVAKSSGIEESRVAKKALYIANKESTTAKKVHIGNIILGKDKKKLYKNLDAKIGLRQRIENSLYSMRGMFYFGGLIIIFTASVILFSMLFSNLSPSIAMWKLITLLAIIIFPVLGVCIEIMNMISQVVVPPAEVASMDFSKEIPDRYRTFVVMPVILGNTSQIEDYVRKLERYYLGNIQNNLYFAIIGDFKDAATRETPEDEIIISSARDAIKKLNNKYPSEKFKFNLFMRYRKYNKSEDCWMGWERKRGKLEEFNELLMEDGETSFDVVMCNKKILKTFRYVITLDSDTELIRESAGKLVGIMAHPLNRPVMNAKRTKVVEGYSIVQSEIRNRLSSVKFSVFSTLFANNPGIDGYSSLVSDVYHDTFNEGIFFGKGIYDIKIFHRLFHGTFPENSVLSHDLLESCYARCAFASGVKLMDKYPTGLVSYIKREHRWIRGDWQLLPWLFMRSPISGLSKWKVFDNIRRSLMQVSLLLLIIGNIILLPQMPLLWIPLVFFSPAIQLLMSIRIIFDKIRNPKSSMCFKNIFASLFKITLQGMLVFILMPLRAYVSLDAILRALYRLVFSHKKMLEWTTAESAEAGYVNTLGSNIVMMLQSVIVGLGLIAAFPFTSTLAGKTSCIVVGIYWLISPVVAYLVSRPSVSERKHVFKEDEITMLRRHARKIWSFVEDHSSEKTNWLCPDNLQVLPVRKATTKTSPTNIGLQLMSILTARDMGYIGIFTFIEHCERVMDSIHSMEKWHGHLYNWYDIETLETLSPRYISTVDSGNFVGYLITLKNAFLNFIDTPILTKANLKGLQDTILLSGLDYTIATNEFSVENWRRILLEIKALTELDRKSGENAKWADTLGQNCTDFLKELDILTNYSNEDTSEAISLKDKPPANSGELIMAGTTESSKYDISNMLITESLLTLAKTGNPEATAIIIRIQTLIEMTGRIINATDFKPLYDDRQFLFRIGYNTDSQKIDSSKYDLLASEARQASFIAIAKGDISQKHWFKLGRPLTIANHMQSLVSWSGSMFEYLMPELIIKNFPNSVINQSCIAMVVSQIKYAKQQDVPWGISESQYCRFDTDSNYQYQAFGISDLSFQSSMLNDLVIAPYATMLALNILPGETILNMNRLTALGAEDQYGFYESIDFSVPDTVHFKRYTIIKSYMMHHQGMSLVSINNAINNKIMQKRFHQEPIVQATEILLEEYNPKNMFTLNNKEYNLKIDSDAYSLDTVESRYYENPTLPYPCAHVLCNDHYMIMMTTGGVGFSKCNDIMINRWRPDSLCNSYGTIFYIRNLSDKSIWSAGYFPLIKEPEKYQAIFSMDKIEYVRKDELIKTHTEITISPIDNIEVRRITLGNESNEDVEIEVTSFIELSNDTYDSDLAHPAFSKLFNETEYVIGSNMIVGKRRPREENEKKRFVVHFVVCDGKMLKGIEFETDKKRFVGRGNTLANPAAMNSNLALSNKDGQSSDPVLSLRVAVSVGAGISSSVAFFTGYCETWDEILALHQKYTVSYKLGDIFELSRVDSELEMFYLNMTSHQINIIQDIIGAIFYPSNFFRTSGDIIKRNSKNQTGLWRFGISGDYPILLLRINNVEDIRAAKDVVMAYEFCKKNLIKVDLVMLNEQEYGYTDEVNSLLMGITSNLRMYDENPQKRSLFILQSHMMSIAEQDLLFIASRLVINAKTGFSYWFTKEILADKLLAEKRLPPYFAKRNYSRLLTEENQVENFSNNTNAITIRRAHSEFYNNIGGFTNHGEEYEIRLNAGQKTPMPWINVIANEHFGFHISESGSGYSWSGNSRENKLTTWSNDPVMDPPSEVIYIRDDESGDYTTVTSSPINDGGAYAVSHGHGYSVFEHESIDIKQKMTVFAAQDDPVKIWSTTIKNTADRKREISMTLYVEWVLGVSRESTSPYLVTEMDRPANLMKVRNVYSANFGNIYAFVSSSEKIVSYSGNRAEFIGNRGTLQNPEGLREKEFTGTEGAGYDPCSAIMVKVTLDPNERKEIIFIMGQTNNEASSPSMNSLVDKYCSLSYAKIELGNVKQSWKSILGQIKVETPDRALNLMINEWLLYQVISCRLRAKAAFYQCGGAVGFRDQLQDVMALLNVEPERARRQIVLCCSRQFIEGDVQHWWHQHTGQGVRTRISDDLLWLPYTTAMYVKNTGDYAILDEQADYLHAELLNPDESEKYFIPDTAQMPESVYLHCIKAIEKSLVFGIHGLPLMGSGDWNDGMNRVGAKGKGESVWLGWFLYTVLNEFAPICIIRGDEDRAEKYKKVAELITQNIEKHAWDGQWYLRAFFDDGTPIGSEKNEECKIDSISQSWSILSGAADKTRSLTAIQSADRHLVKEEDGVICLLTPPFDSSPFDPGYIKGYYPGVRENGGQYTHAAIWLAMAHMRLRDGDGAYKLLSMMNPVNTTSSYKGATKYEQEPYVITADIYSQEPYGGKGGWSWYTGSAGWMYQALICDLLGIRKVGQRLYIDPTIPGEWNEYKVIYRYGNTEYTIIIENPNSLQHGCNSITLDNEFISGNSFELVDDGVGHVVKTTLSQSL